MVRIGKNPSSHYFLRPIPIGEKIRNDGQTAIALGLARTPAHDRAGHVPQSRDMDMRASQTPTRPLRSTLFHSVRIGSPSPMSGPSQMVVGRTDGSPMAIRGSVESHGIGRGTHLGPVYLDCLSLSFHPITPSSLQVIHTYSNPVLSINPVAEIPSRCADYLMISRSEPPS